MRRALLTAHFVPTLLALLAVPAVAQVGYLPSESPYHDIRGDRWLELTTGKVFGSGGPLQVGPRDGILGGARVSFRSNHTLQLSLGAWYANTVRHVVDANDSVATRVKPDIPHALYAGEFTLQLNVTGAKSWHALAPYSSLGIGLVHGQKSPAADTSGYSFGTHFYFAPAIGTRVMLAPGLALRFEARELFWKLKYPSSYSLEPSKQPGTTDHPNAVNVTGKAGEYTATPALLIGLSVRF